MQQPSPKQHGLSADEARALTTKVLGYAQADHTRVQIQAGRRGFTRSAINRVTTAGGSDDVRVRISGVFGKRAASVETNRLDDAALMQAVQEVESLARLSPENPEYMPELGAQKFTTVQGYYESTGDLSTEARAAAAAIAVKSADRNRMVAAGYIDVVAGTETVATSNGLFAHGATTGVASSLTIRTPDGLSSGWAGDEGGDWSTIQSERVAEDAVRKCRDWKGKTSLEPGKYDVILEPAAAGMLMLRMMQAFDARQADEGRSYFSRRGGGNQIGEKLFDERVTILSDPAASNAETNPFTNTGLPVSRTPWIEQGVLRTLSYSRFWADRRGVAPVAPPQNLVVSGGDASLDDLIRGVKRGVLITRFWYIRGLDPRRIAFTGILRDGTFFIESGKVTRPVNNFRFNQSLVDLLQNVVAFGKAERVCASENSSVGPPVVVPAMHVRDFNLSSVSDAV